MWLNSKLEIRNPKQLNRKSEIVNRSILTEPAALEKIGTGTLCVLSENDDGRIYGRAFTVADKLKDDRVVMSKWVRRLIAWNGRQAPLTLWTEKIAPLLEEKLAQQQTPVVRFTHHPHKIMAQVSLAELTMRVPMDSHGVALWKPQEREVLPADCARCALVPTCRKLLTVTGTALLWRRLGLVDAAGVPTKRGQIVSFFQQGDGLAIAAALEDGSYPLDELIYDLADSTPGSVSAARKIAGPGGSRWPATKGSGCSPLPAISKMACHRNTVPARNRSSRACTRTR